MKENFLDKKKVLLGMSGGVDSTTAALLLKKAGYEVIGCYFDVTEDSNLSEWKQAEKASKELGIDIEYVNVHEAFEEKVVHPFCEEYSLARTPNPCITCNPSIKFPTLIKKANEVGAYYIATGHYAKTAYSKELGRWVLMRAEDRAKDQTYMLYRLPENILKRLLMPLGDIASKKEVRNLASKAELSSAELGDSQGICFLAGDEDYARFLTERGYEHIRGNFVDLDGNILGEHKGIMNYTLGQRKGLGVSLGKPMYVVAIDGKKNEVILGDNEDLFTKEVVIDGLIGDLTNLPETFLSDLTAKTRHVIREANCHLEPADGEGEVKVVFDKAQRAITPGQSVVFYSKDVVVGGGVVKSPIL